MPLNTIDQPDMAVPVARYEDLIKYVDFLNEGMTPFEIDRPNRIAAFVAELAHESGDFRHTEEDLNYSWQGLRETWPRKFTTGAMAPSRATPPCRRAGSGKAAASTPLPMWEKIASEGARCAGSADHLRWSS